jgi:hypothetical protein
VVLTTFCDKQPAKAEEQKEKKAQQKKQKKRKKTEEPRECNFDCCGSGW